MLLFFLWYLIMEAILALKLIIMTNETMLTASLVVEHNVRSPDLV